MAVPKVVLSNTVPSSLTHTDEAALLARLHMAGFGKRSWTEAAFASLLRDAHTYALLATLSDERAGFVLWRTMAEEAEILTLAVAPEWQRQGIAMVLLQSMKAELVPHEVKECWLEVGVRNNTARALYRKAGYVECGRRPGYYRCPDGTREDALLMRRKLPISQVCSMMLKL